ncbi:hypothetical protein PDESU_00435 [Pontiella desulfatans]|uniref:Uncharacterized protein n=1 Tax=Pontiella desulfatans TaxID=2750659 RepID=A0A6C2TWE6_PONDE|nr:tetratricopeptide repeat protein [Pontiella desulfatans]VGO11887.1 hypothetical protein PDESU_00435 [Pontiella desulfatans]
MKRIKHSVHGCIVLALLCTLPGCQTTAPPPGNAPEEITHHNWWNYYERGTHYLQQGKVALAREDFERSLGIRTGAKYGFPQDMWRAKTYGMHFLDHYFPNRELGICLYELGETDEARRLLEKSLEQEPSGRAKFYLNKVRADLNTSTQLPNPTVTAKANTQGEWTNKKSVSLSVSSEAKGYIKDVAINKERQFIELAALAYQTTQEIKLRSGMNEIPVQVADLNGRKTTTTVRIRADWEAPVISVDRIMVFPGHWVAHCICSDNGSLQTITLNGKTLLTNSRGETKTAHPFEVRFDQANSPTLVAVDMAGNRIEETFSPKLTKTALNKYGDPSHSQGLESGFLFASTTAETDRQPPYLKVDGAGRTHTVFDEEFYIDGLARDGSGIASLTLNGEELLYSETKNPQSSRFGRRVSLNPGTNTYSIVAMDPMGNKTSKELTVVSKEPEYEQEEYRLTVGLPPLVSDTTSLGPLVRSYMLGELQRSPMRFQLVARNEGWDYILQEQKLSMSGLSDPNFALRISKMLPAELLLRGFLVEHGNGTTVQLRVLDSAKGNIIQAPDVYLGGNDDVEYEVAGLIMKLKQHFPVVTGKVLDVAGSKVTIDIGKNQGVNQWSKFVVLHADPPDEPLAETTVHKHDQQFVQLEIERLTPTMLTARVLPSKGSSMIRKGDHVYAR